MGLILILKGFKLKIKERRTGGVRCSWSENLTRFCPQCFVADSGWSPVSLHTWRDQAATWNGTKLKSWTLETSAALAHNTAWHWTEDTEAEQKGLNTFYTKTRLLYSHYLMYSTYFIPKSVSFPFRFYLPDGFAYFSSPEYILPISLKLFPPCWPVWCFLFA